MIEQVELLDTFIDEGIRDTWFPFTNARLPKALSPPMQAEFIGLQSRVYTKGLSLETGGERLHAHFAAGEILPFKVQELLGEGTSQVHKITSHISQRTYARKQFRRAGNSRAVKNEIKNFMTELQVLKRLHHHHCVQLVASYTDPRYFALIMSPVADCNMVQFYKAVSDNSTRKSILRNAFGCLAAAVAYLHAEKLRHRDIKPQNILMKGSQVYLTDFGVSLDWINLSRSTTTADAAKTWIYCAPEVAHYEPRNSASDVWSLGCVFLEMTTVLKDSSLEELRSHFKLAGDNESQAYWFWKAPNSIQTWSKYLRTQGFDWDNTPLDWTAEMLKAADERPSAAELVDLIDDFKRDNPQCPVSYCGDCCGSIDLTEESDPEDDLFHHAPSVDSINDDQVLLDKPKSPLIGPKPSTSQSSLVLKGVKALHKGSDIAPKKEGSKVNRDPSHFYERHTIRKTPPEDPQTQKSTWARSLLQREGVDQNEILNQIERLNGGRRSISDKIKSFQHYQRQQIIKLLDDLNSVETPGFLWSIAQLDSEVKTPNDGQRETTVISCYMKRKPHKGSAPDRSLLDMAKKERRGSVMTRLLREGGFIEDVNRK